MPVLSCHLVLLLVCDLDFLSCSALPGRATMSPTFFIVPGLWEGPGAFGPLKALLEQSGSSVFTTSLPSTGTKYPGNPTMDQDIAAIRGDLERVVDRAGDEGVVVVLHSAGGFLGSNAMEGLSATIRKSQGKAGGVVKIVFIAAGIMPEGADQFGGPFILEQVSCFNPLRAWSRECRVANGFRLRTMEAVSARTPSSRCSTTSTQKMPKGGRMQLVYTLPYRAGRPKSPIAAGGMCRALISSARMIVCCPHRCRSSWLPRQTLRWSGLRPATWHSFRRRRSWARYC